MDNFGEALRTMREAAAMSLSSLANRANVSKSLLGHLETGVRQPTAGIAEAVDRALRAGGTLIELAAIERGGDDMRRRALLATVGAAASLGTIGGPHAIGDMVRYGLLDAAGSEEDWDGVAADCASRLVTDPSPLLGSALLTNLMILQQQLAEKPSKVLFRSAASIGQTYGLWLGNHGELGGANRWYRSCATLASRSGDTTMLAYTLGRSASRGVYEDWTVQRTLDTATAALAVTSRPNLGALEAHAARIGVYALTQDTARGRASLDDMADVAERLPVSGQTGPGPAERLAFLRAFFECRAGDLDSATTACTEAQPILATTAPTWWVETQVYWARAMVAAGDVRGGLAYALGAIEQCPHDVRVIKVAARDVCTTVPAGYRGDGLAALWRHADRSPGPWETLR